ADGRAIPPQAREQLVTKTNYYYGRDRSKWRTNVPSYAKVGDPSVRGGGDLVYHGEDGSLEYDFVVAPGTSGDGGARNGEGAADVSLAASGDLVIHTRVGDIVQPRPVVYQQDARGKKEMVKAAYRLVGPAKVGFEVAAYDRARPLVIDPVIGFATYLGGNSTD